MKVWQFDPAQMTAYYNYALCDALSGAGADVTYFTSRYIYDDVIVPDTFTTEYIYFRGMDSPIVRRSAWLRKLLRGLTYPLGHFEAVRRAKQAHPEIVHLQWSRLPRFDKPFIGAMRRQGAKIVHTVHDVVPLFEHPSNRHRIGEIYGLCDALIVHAEANRAELLEVFPELDPDRVAVIPMVSPQHVFVEPSTDRFSVRKDMFDSLTLNSKSLVLLFLGNLKRYKGLDLLFDAFEQVAQVRDDISLVVAGKVDDGSALSTIGEASRTKGLVVVRAGYIPTSEVWKYFCAADIAIFPYRHIYQSAAVVTAMGYGLPIIATAVGALPETIDWNGWVVPATADALAQAIMEAAARRDELPAMGQRSLDLIRTRHAPGVVGERLMSVYRALLN